MPPVIRFPRITPIRDISRSQEAVVRPPDNDGSLFALLYDDEDGSREHGALTESRDDAA